MSIESDVCAFIRGRRDKAFAMDIAPTVFCISYTRIFEILQNAGLIDLNGNYIEPLRLTGKEQIMEKKINYPSFRWSPERKQKLEELYQAGTTPSDIATHLGTTTDIVYEGISKFDITRTRQFQRAEPAADPSEPERKLPAAEDSPAPLLNLEELSEIRRYVTYTQELVRDASRLFLDDRCYEAFQAIGKQEILLQNAQQILRKVFPVIQSREP